MLKKTILFVLLGISVYSCNKVPVTGRKQVNLLREDTMLSLSREQYQQFLNQAKLIKTGHQALMVKNVGEKMAKSVEYFLKHNGFKSRLNQFDWEFNLVDDPAINAWCMPGGKVCFYTGILPITMDEEGLAVVMGHEIAHAVARHGNERMSTGIVTSLGGMALDVALSKKPEMTRSLFLQAYGVGTQVGVTLPFSRKNELEADQMGVVFMKLSGYNPEKAIDFWKRMGALSGKTPEFLSTHPSDERRVDEIKKFITSPNFAKYTK